MNSNPNGVATARSWMSGKSAEEQQSAYQKSYAQPASEPKKKSKKEKQAELAESQKEYEQEDRDRTAVYEWNQSAKKIMEQGAREGKSPAEIRAMLPPEPVLMRRAPQESHWPDMIQKMLDFTGIRKMMEKMGPALDAWQLEHVIPQKPDYLSKHTEKKVYLSRYTFQVLVIDPQMVIAELNILFGAVAIITAIPTGGGSLYLLMAADIAIGAATIIVNGMKLYDLKNGNGNTNPNIFGLDQAMLDNLGIAITVVSLASLLKHGLYKTADKLANSRNIAALEELEDASRAGGTGNGANTPRTGPEWDEYFRSKYGDENVDWKTSSEYSLYPPKYIPYTPKIRPNETITKPSLPEGGKPEGDYAKATGKDTRGIDRQNEAADVLAENGYRTIMLDEVPNGNGFGGNGYGINPDKSPDFIIERQVFDCYAPESTNLKNILKMLRDKTTDQARRIVLNLNDYPIEKRAELIEFILSQTHKDLKHLNELLVIEGRQVTRAYWRYE
ncbi:CdiA C-terminal domain-containing protein [Paenibacillus durus]|uniref:CdiA C-terminal domain-containing protein n=1 Tax=Paenibacillus durus TaxID=44251 RepID=UPI0012E09042|nr:hypothetical protein [Paenibacillus durus]